MSPDKSERRRVHRRPVLDSFSMFVVVPKKGPYRLRVHDISNLGIGFDIDVDGEPEVLAIAKGEEIDVHFYLNQSLYLPLKVTVARIEKAGLIRRIGAEVAENDSPGHKALQAFVQMLDAVILAGKFGETG